MKLENKIALITGASRGIGEAIARAYAKEGADIYVHYVSKPNMAQTLVEDIQCMGRRAWAVRADIGRPADIDEMFDAIRRTTGNVDILVNNAGFEFGKPFYEFSVNEWDTLVNVNLRGAFLCMQQATRMMIEKKSGVIINMSSIHDSVPRPEYMPYCVSKAGMLMMTRCAALELAKKNIRVNAISPGAILTDMNRASIEKLGPSFWLDHIPMQRVGETKDVTAAAVFLASDDAAYVSGSTLYIDGAYRLHTIRT